MPFSECNTCQGTGRDTLSTSSNNNTRININSYLNYNLQDGQTTRNNNTYPIRSSLDLSSSNN